MEVANDAVDSGELKAEWKGDAYNLQDIQSTLMIRKSPPEGATGHSIYVTRDHDIWSFARSEKGDTTTSVAGEGDASKSGIGCLMFGPIRQQLASWNTTTGTTFLIW